MIKVKDVKTGDKLFVVYKDLDENYQIGEATVTGFKDWIYEAGDYWETREKRPMTNILYEFNGIKFSRTLEYILEDTRFGDHPDAVNNEFATNVAHIMSETYVTVFTTKDEAKDYVLSYLRERIDVAHNTIEEFKEKIEFYRKNYEAINEN